VIALSGQRGIGSPGRALVYACGCFPSTGMWPASWIPCAPRTSLLLLN